MRTKNDLVFILILELILKILYLKLKKFKMDKITKFLLKLSEKERLLILSIMEKILILDLD